jgi:predicted nucleotidyltransferase
MISQSQIEACVEVARKYGATRLLLFGRAKDNPLEARDIDLICDGVTGWDMIRMGAEMERSARACVDVVPDTPENEFVAINKPESKVLYEADQ